MERNELPNAKRGYLASSRFPKVKTSKEGIIQGFDSLKSVWERGLRPKDLRKHYFLTWFAFSNGVLTQQAKILGMDRIALIFTFGRIGLGEQTVKFRRLWLKALRVNPKKSFHTLILSFYRKTVKKPIIKPNENKNLVRLWLMGFPLKVLSAQYVLWAYGSGLTRNETAKKLEISNRTLYRLVSFSSRKGSNAEAWLSPLKPQMKDWHPKWAPHVK
jgi:hypothetical protein